MSRFILRTPALLLVLSLLPGCAAKAEEIPAEEIPAEEIPAEEIPTAVERISGQLLLENSPLAGVVVQFWLKEELPQFCLKLKEELPQSPESRSIEVHGCAKTGPDGGFRLAPLASKPWKTGVYVISVFDPPPPKAAPPQAAPPRDTKSKGPRTPRTPRYPREYATHMTSPLEVEIRLGVNDLGAIVLTK